MYAVFLKLNFGLRNGPLEFHKFSGAIRDAAAQRGVHTLVYMLDDFWGYAPTKERAMADMWLFMELLVELGVHPKWSKVVLPCRKVIFLGITIDVLLMELSLDAAKVRKYQGVLAEFVGGDTATVQEVRSICGILNHVSVVIPCLKPWLRACLDLLKGKPTSGQVVKLPPHLKGDVRYIGEVLMREHNSRTLASKVGRWHVEGELETDASTSTGWGWCWQEKGWCQMGRWHGPQCDWHINMMELYTVLVVLRVLLPHCANAVLSVVVDNTVTRGWLRKVGASSWEATLILREVALLLLQHNTVLTVRWVASKENPRADALSRDDMQQLHDAWDGWCSIPIVWL